MPGAVQFKDVPFLIVTVSASALGERGTPGRRGKSGPVIPVNVSICFPVTATHTQPHTGSRAEPVLPLFKHWDLPGECSLCKQQRDGPAGLFPVDPPLVRRRLEAQQIPGFTL